MSDDAFMHISSNSSNQSDQSPPTKISRLEKLEARLVGKSPPAAASGQPLKSAVSTSKFGPFEDLAIPSTPSDSDDDNGREFLIQAKTQKRQKLDVHVEGASEEKQKTIGILDSKADFDMNRKNHGRGRGNTVSSKGRRYKNYDQSRMQAPLSTILPSDGYLEDCHNKDDSSQEQLENDSLSSLKEEAVTLRAKVVGLEEELCKSHQELKDLKECEQKMKPKRAKIISDLLVSVSKVERREVRLKVRQDSLRLGNVGVIRAGTVISEGWEDGQALKDVNDHLKNLLETKQAVERQRKSLKKRQPDRVDATDSESGVQEEDVLILDEVYKSRLASIKREEEMLLRERDRCELEKGRLIREMKRIRDEDGSRFNNFQILNHRYALMNLLGKGGFSEVYKAFDLIEHRYVACKLHGLNAQWCEEKKQSYTRHAVREYNIHKSLVHSHIVRLWDIFEIDRNTFCTVLEYCSGKDLDAVLKATPILPEKEAKIIMVQIFQGLVYLNKRAQKVIHYDLKPGNVLFDEHGAAKVTDFGLSKIVEGDVGSRGMELTSQGAGTYWYLPPECFELSKTPLISSKVDVWSAGILFYQMLFGKRPFGHDQSQEHILREDTIVKARKVEFPSRPAASNEAKDFIRQCLTYNQSERPEVLSIAEDPYLSYSKK